MSFTLKAIISDLISVGRCGSWEFVLSSVLVSESVIFGDGSGLLGAYGIGAQVLFGLGCLRGFLWGNDNESPHFSLRLVLRRGVAYVSESC